MAVHAGDAGQEPKGPQGLPGKEADAGAQHVEHIRVRGRLRRVFERVLKLASCRSCLPGLSSTADDCSDSMAHFPHVVKSTLTASIDPAFCVRVCVRGY